MKDINDVLREEGPDAVRRLSDQAEPYKPNGRGSSHGWQMLPDSDASDTGQHPNGGKRLIVCRASDVIMKPVDWVWERRLAIGAMTLVGGDPGLGKTQFLCDVTARITRGNEFPCEEGRARIGSVVLLAAEDSIESVLVPRLKAAGADLGRVRIVTAVEERDADGRDADERRLFNFTKDMNELEAEIRRLKDVRLVGIDPINAYTGKVDGFVDTQVRQVLIPISMLAERCRVAICSLTHFTKSGGPKALHRFLGSVAYVAVARMAFAVLEDPEDEGRRFLLHAKSNLSAPAKGLAFRTLQITAAETEAGEAIPASYVEWEKTHVINTADATLAAHGDTEANPRAKDDAIDFLQAELAAGAVKVQELDKQAKAAGLLTDAQAIGQSKPFREARKALGIVPRKLGMKKGWAWELPKPPEDALKAEDALPK
jgi:putative DNA primase/helicase